MVEKIKDETMSEVEKLMQNAGIEKAPDINNCYPEMMKCHHCEHYKVIDEYTGRCLNEVYPEFTEEKQLNLLKYIEQLDWIDAIVSFFYMDEYWVFLAQPIKEFANEQYRDFGGKQKEYEQAVAQMINTLWQDLTETEKAEIKRILE